MDCHSYNELIHIYLDGDATKEQKEQLEAHLTNCPSCKEHLHELKKINCLHSKFFSYRGAS